MSKSCPNCGNVVDDNARFCNKCASNLDAVQQTAPPQQSVTYVVPPVQQYQQPTYQQPVEQPMTVGQWVGTIICTTWFGVISLILCCVWGFNETTPIAKRNYCKAALVMQIIGIVLGIIFVAIYAGVIMSIINSGEFDIESFNRAFNEAAHM